MYTVKFSGIHYLNETFQTIEKAAEFLMQSKLLKQAEIINNKGKVTAYLINRILIKLNEAKHC